MNVLLIVLDSVRAANTTLHGHENDTTPFLDTLAAESTTFSQARSPGTWSLPSHVSLFTGAPVAGHGIVDIDDKLASGNTVFDDLGDSGYATAVFSENTWLTEMDVGLHDPFDTVEGARNAPFRDGLDPGRFVLSEGQGRYVEYLRACLDHEETLKSLANGVVGKLGWERPSLVPDLVAGESTAELYADLFLDWEREQQGDWASCVNLMDAHTPYAPGAHDEWGGTRLQDLQTSLDDQVWAFLGGERPWWECRALEALYDGAIRRCDSAVERIVETLRERNVLDDTLLVVTSDHGETFGEWSRLRRTRLAGHGKGVHEALLHVPLLVRPPGGSDGDVVESPATLTQFPAVVDAARTDPNGAPREFVPDGPVVASDHGLESPSVELAEAHGVDVGTFTGTDRAVYRSDGDAAVRYASNNERTVTTRVYDARTATVIEADDSASVLDRTFDKIDDAGIRVGGEGVAEMDSTTKNRLRRLGYL